MPPWYLRPSALLTLDKIPRILSFDIGLEQFNRLESILISGNRDTDELEMARLPGHYSIASQRLTPFQDYTICDGILSAMEEENCFTSNEVEVLVPHTNFHIPRLPSESDYGRHRPTD